MIIPAAIDSDADERQRGMPATRRGRAFRAALAAVCIAPPIAAPGSAAAQALTTVDANRAPFAAVALVNNSVGGRCTGVLVGSTVAITAAHCLYNRRTKRFVRPQSVHVLLGFDRGTYRFHTVAASVARSPAYDPEGPVPSPAEDWAILTLSQAVPDEIAPMPVAEDPGAARDVFAAGFARQRSQVMTRTPACTLESLSPEGVLLSDCAVTPGLSGGPLIETASGRLVAIQIAAGMRDGRPIAFSLSARAILAHRP